MQSCTPKLLVINAITLGTGGGHSIETILLYLLSYIYVAVDSSQLSLLTLFNGSTAFNTVDHEIVLKRLEISFGLSGNFLSWVGSFLSERWSMGPLGHHGSLPLWCSPGFSFGSPSYHYLHLQQRTSSHCHFLVGSPVC